jgi:chromosome segregation ATPase
MTGDNSKFVRTQADRSLNGKKERMDYLAVEVQTDRDLGYDAALNAERARWAQEKFFLQGELDALRGDKSRALADVDFFREQYQRASAFASTTRTENEELLARATVAESQAVNGVAMVRATFDTRVAKLEAEARKHKALSEMLTERARRTDDEVRYRAALMPELERKFRELHQQFVETEAELEETGDELRAEKRANVKLRRRLATLEANAPAPDHDAEASRQRERALWSDDDRDEEDHRPDLGPSSPPQHGESHSLPNVEKGDDAQPPDDDPEQMASVGLDASAQSSNDDVVYLCRWRPGDPTGYCHAVVASRQVKNPNARRS